jgi:hypothetical protein
MSEIPDVVARFWAGVDKHDWDMIASTISPDFVRIGMSDTEADTCRGKDNYVRFAAGVIGRFDHHELESRSGYASADGRRVTHEAIETIQPPGSEPIRMRFINIMEIGDDGLITKLDIFWKTPPVMPPAWIEVATVLADENATEE